LPFFIVHDAIYVPASKKEEMRALAAQTMEKHLGWPGRWKTSDLSCPDIPLAYPTQQNEALFKPNESNLNNLNL
jgi:hypothetical protein